MENKLAENIRRCRKDLGLTQDQLAERLGITLGTISKWERGSSEPDLAYLMSLAELFHISVDALIGFTMHGTDADEEAVRLEEKASKIPFEQLAEEYENALKRFPNHFRLVLGAAEACKRIGVMDKKSEYLEKALPLYRHALELISQNHDPCINELYLHNEIAGIYSEMKNYKKAVEEFKKNNLNGCNDAKIGLLLTRHEKKPEEGIEYTQRAFLNAVSEFSTIMGGYVDYYIMTSDLENAIRASSWTIGCIRNLKLDPARRSFLDKIISLSYLMLALVQDADGQQENSVESLRTAFRIARTFDSDPVYSLENIVFTEHAPETLYVYDDAGPTAVEALKAFLEDTDNLVLSDSFRQSFDSLYNC